MATPHVTGAVALARDRAPGASLKKIFTRLRARTCQAELGNPPDPDSCGGIMWNDFPNHIYGNGRLDIAYVFGVNPGPCM